MWLWRRTELFAALIAGCAGDAISLDGAPCPCLPGYVCCAEICVAEGACPLPELQIASVSPSLGPFEGGTEIAVQGSGFAPPIEVTVGGAPCRGLQVVDSRNLTCTTARGPAQGRLADVVVTAPDGRFAVLPASFRYSTQPLLLVEHPLAAAPGEGVTVADLDGDQRLDLLVAGAGAESRIWFGAGGFDLAPGPSLTTSLVQSFPADAGGDGRVDLIAVTAEGEVWIHHQSSGGAFDPERQANLRSGVRAIAPFDLDPDGQLDLALCRDGTGGALEVSTARGIGRGFTETGTAVVPAGREGPCSALASGDLDRDGDEDLVACGTGLFAFENRAGGLVDQTAGWGLGALTFPAGLPRCSAIDLVDYDRDGDLDVSIHWDAHVYGDRSPSTRAGVSIVENQLGAGGGFGARPDLDRDAGPLRGWCPDYSDADAVPHVSLIAGTGSGVWLDADRDGDLDLFEAAPLAICARPPVLYQSRFADDGLGFVPQVLSILGVLTDPSGGVAADLDADGDLDVLQHHHGRGRTAIFRNTAGEAGSAITAGRGLLLRALWRGQPRPVTIELDLDETPDFAPGPGRLQVRALGVAGRRSFSGYDAHFGLGSVSGTVHARARFPGGSEVVLPIAAGVTRAELSVD